MDKRNIFAGFVIVAIVVGVALFLKATNVTIFPRVAEAPTVKSVGPANAPIELVEYSDFECPACAHAEPVIKGLLEAYPGKIRFIFRHYPLPGHQHANFAHQASECAHRSGQFWPYHDLLYANQKAWSKLEDPSRIFLEYARVLDINLDGFVACLGDETIREEVMAEKQSGDKLVVKSTPTFFINGERFVGGHGLKRRGEPFIREILGLPPLEGKA